MQNEMRDWLVRRLHDWGITRTEELADYLIANGVLVPPCKVGDIVYCIATVNDALHPTFSWGCCEKYRIVKCTCKSIDVHLPTYSEYNPQIYCTDKIEDHKGTDFHFLLKPEDFGTEAFLTKEEAEQKLYDMPEVKCGEYTVCDGSVYSMCFRKEDEGK